jgi:hypothetical protein
MSIVAGKQLARGRGSWHLPLPRSDAKRAAEPWNHVDHDGLCVVFTQLGGNPSLADRLYASGHHPLAEALRFFLTPLQLVTTIALSRMTVRFSTASLWATLVSASPETFRIPAHRA